MQCKATRKNPLRFVILIIIIIILVTFKGNTFTSFFCLLYRIKNAAMLQGLPTSKQCGVLLVGFLIRFPKSHI